MKEFNEIVHKDVPYKVRIQTATKIRDYTDAASVELRGDFKRFKISVEVFSERNRFSMPDSIGICIFYPNLTSVTHHIGKIFPLSMNEIGFAKQTKTLYQELRNKIPEEIWQQ
jgi:hypothetical protein